ncbi:MAG: aminotransferase class V-fold PLP-dependent enzyme [Candidatus Nanohaloarchaea archaeon]
MTLQPGDHRPDFPALEEEKNGKKIAYLDNAATTQKPEKVLERIQRFYREENANVGRSMHELANRATQAYEGARRTVAEFMGADAEEVVFVRNTTEGMNMLAETLDLDGKILVPEMAHHSEQLPWRRKAEREDLEIQYIPTSGNELDLEAAEEMMDEEVALVSVSHVSNVFGCVNPVEELADLAHQNDALIVVDGAQSVPRMPVDVKEMDADFLVFSGHKMCGPTGSGAVYGRRELLEDLEPYQVGGGMIESVKRDGVRWAETPQRFEAGTPDIAAAVGLEAAAEYVEQVGRKKILEHEKGLAGKMAEELGRIDGVTVHAPEEPLLVSFTMEEAHPHDVAEILDREAVAVRAGHHCAQPQMEEMGISGTTRASPYLYTTEEEVRRLIKGVEKVREVFGGGP